DRRLIQSLGAQDFVRPTLDRFYDSPQGYWRIHYTTTGSDAVYQADVDNNGNGVPDYVETIGLIADSVYDFEVNQLGYPAPLSDATCPNNDDGKVDLYLHNIQAGFFGFTVADTNSACGFQSTPMSLPSWIEMDNDFQQISLYRNRPLDAARVTLAHEFFHTIHFTIDWSENRVLWEMTATWMEEQMYDDINDYYTIIPLFYDHPSRSLQSDVDLHHYASTVWALYLTEKYGSRDIIKHVWLRCGELGLNTPTDGGDYMQAFAEAIDSASGGADNLASDMNEFAVWNYFTGIYAADAPNALGFSEGANYPVIPFDSLDHVDTLPVFVVADSNSHNPDLNASTYIRFENVNITQDSIFNPRFSLSAFPNNWGISEILELRRPRDSNIVIDTFVVDTNIFDAAIPNPQQYRTITFVLTPVDSNGSHFPPPGSTFKPQIGYFSGDIAGPADGIIDSQFIAVPAAVLTPYPNPAVVPEMGGADLVFRFQVPTTDSALYEFTSMSLVVDLYTVAGEHVATIKEPVDIQIGARQDPHAFNVTYSMSWDMHNQSGHEVASGVYLAYARLYGPGGKQTLAEDRVKVAIIR
ncbi:MAG: hypothetical protein D6800_14410, partial [Candidatus Zixiibacteriota bacterium]